MGPPDPHRRYNPLRGEWVLVSAGRTRRPWQGQSERRPHARRPAYDPECALCPGNSRAGGRRNPDYAGTFVFTNDYPALRPGTADRRAAPHPLLRTRTERGTCRVLCFSPRHDLTLAVMTVSQVRAVAELWLQQLTDLAPRYRWVQLFENRGEAMGASNPHPHGQVWATAAVPSEPAREDATQRAHQEHHGRPLLLDYGDLEHRAGDRVVIANASWMVVVPFWAVWPFETLVLPRRHVTRLTDVSEDELGLLAALLQALFTRYDNLFETPFPYSMGWHNAPGWGQDQAHWQLHAHVYPPLLRSATVRKFMVGYELLAEAQRDLTAEDAAARLRAVDGRHYLRRGTQPDADPAR